MATRSTELIAKFTGDGSALIRELDKVKSKVSDATNTSSIGLKDAGVHAKKFGAELTGVTNALGQFQQKGTAAIGDVVRESAGLAGVFGPTGLIVGGIAVAVVAMVELFTRAKSEAKKLKDDLAKELDGLENAGDTQSLQRKQASLFFGTASKNFSDSPKAIQQRIDKLEDELTVTGKLSRYYRERQEALIKEKQALKAVGDTWEELGKRIARAQDVAKNAGRDGTLKAVTITAESPEAAAAKAAAAAQKIAEIERNARALLTSLNDAGAIAQGQRALEEWIATAQKANVPVKTVTELVEQLQKALAGKAERQGKAVAQQLAELAAQSTLTAIDDLGVALEKSRDQLESLAQKAEDAGDFVQAQRIREQAIPALEEQNKQLVELTKTLEEADAARRQAAVGPDFNIGGISSRTIVDVAATSNELKKLQAQLKSGNLDSKVRADIEKRILEITKQQDKVQADIAKSLAQQPTHLEKIANKLNGIAEAALVVVQAFTGVGSEISHAFQGLTQITGGVQKIAELAAKNGGLSKIFSFSGSNKNLIGSLAGVASIVGGFATIANAVDLFGQKSAERAKVVHDALVRYSDELTAFAETTKGLSGVAGELANARRELSDALKEAATATGQKLVDPNAALSRASADALEERANRLLAKGGEDGLRGAQLLDFVGALREALDKLDERAKTIAPRVLKALDLEFKSATGDQAGVALAEAAQHLQDTFNDLQALLAAGAISVDDYAAAVSKAETIFHAAQERIEADRIRAERTLALSSLDAENDVLGGSAVEQLTRTFNRLQALFPQFAGLFDGLDTSTRDGLKAARERLLDEFRKLDADGIISESEQPIFDAIKRLLAGIDASLGELPDAVDPIADALEAFRVRVEVFGLSFAEQLTGLIAIIGDQLPKELREALANADLATGEGRDAAKKAIEAQIAAILDDGVISESEAPLLAQLRELLAAIVGTISDAANAAADEAQRIEKEQREAETKRRALVSSTLDRASNTIKLGGLTGRASFDKRTDAFAELSPALASLISSFNTSTVAGIDASKKAIFDLFRAVDEGRIPAEALGDLTKDEVIDALIELTGGLDDLADSMRDAAEAAAEQAHEQQSLELRLHRAQGADTRVAEFDLNAEEQRQAARDKKRDAAYLAFLDQVLAAERAELLQSIATESTAAADQAANADRSTRSGKSDDSLARTVAGITDVSAQTLAGFLRQIEFNTRASAASDLAIERLLSGIAPNSSLPIPNIPTFAPSIGGARGPSIVISGDIVIHVASAPADIAPEVYGGRFGRGFVEQMSRDLGVLTNIDMIANGGVKR